MFPTGPARSLMIATLVSGLFTLAATKANAQSDESFDTSVPGVVSPTPEMWFYLQEVRRQQDPAEAVRRNAERRASQRRNRLTALKWFGFSNLRPQASPSPFTGTYSPFWSGNSRNPYRWVGAASPFLLQSIPWPEE